MGRHAAPLPPRRTPAAAQIPGRGTSTATAGFLVAAAAAVVAGVTVFAVAASGVGLLARPATQPPPSPSPTPTVSQVALTASPAQAVVTTTLGIQPASGWVPASALGWTGGTPFDDSCGRPQVDAAVSGTRIYAVGRRQIVATVSAYSAGAGAVAFAQWTSLLGRCAGRVSRYVASGPTTDAMVVWIGPVSGRPAASALFWRRGDVVGIVATPSSSPDGLAPAAAALDTVMLTSMNGSCASVSSTLADAARSPWIDGTTFTGLTNPVPVTVAPSPLPVPPIGVTPPPAGYSPTPLPSVSLPMRPADPVWPQDLPTPLASPSQPVFPVPAPTVSVVPSRADDPVGPGCGWAFTGQVKPPYDEAEQAAVANALAVQAQQQLSGAQALWQSDVVSYWQQVPVYQQQAAAFLAYAAAVQRVADSWDSITRQRDDYAAAVAAYDAAVQIRNDFLDQQAVAQAAYDDELVRCSAVPSSTPAPTDTSLPTPTPTGTATPGPSDTGLPGCPPVVPPILLQTPPPLPPLPTPPPDPRPPSAISPSPTR